jgi:1-deoxy-D-xylulose-5-phosphate synthase
LPDRFIDHGDPAQLLKDAGLDAAGIVEAVRRRLPLPTREARYVKSVA